MKIKISDIPGMLFMLFPITILLSIPFAFIYDLNVTAIWTYPLYSLLDALSGYFRYSSLFLHFTVVPIIVLVIIIAVIAGIQGLLKNKEAHLVKKIIYPVLGLVLLTILIRFAIPSIVEDFRIIY